jgi:hypothetical protein
MTTAPVNTETYTVGYEITVIVEVTVNAPAESTSEQVEAFVNWDNLELEAIKQIESLSIEDAIQFKHVINKAGEKI